MNQDLQSIQKSPFEEILLNKDVVDFVRSIIKENYTSFFSGHEQEIKKMVDDSFSLLLDSQNEGINHQKLQKAVEVTTKDIFKKNDEDSWFNSMYREYKTKTRPEKDFKKLKPYIKGKTVLDFGSGGGYVALLMEKNGFNVLTCDVIDYRIPEAKHLPFKAMSSPTNIPFPDNSVDTVIVKAVFHHINNEDLKPTLGELKRVAKRLIVEEDTYNVPDTFEKLQTLKDEQPQLNRFLSLTVENQLRSLMLIDYFSNAIAKGVAEMNFPFQFKTIPEWKRIFQENGYKVSEVKLLGFQEGNVNRTCHVWFICD